MMRYAMIYVLLDARQWQINSIRRRGGRCPPVEVMAVAEPGSKTTYDEKLLPLIIDIVIKYA
jgi:hypothetical protein